VKEWGKKERGITVDGCCLDALVGTIFSDKDQRAAGMDGKGRHIPPGNRISLMAAGAVQRPPCLMLVVIFSEMLLSESLNGFRWMMASFSACCCLIGELSCRRLQMFQKCSFSILVYAFCLVSRV